MSQKISHCERRLTAALYAQIPGVLEHVRREGRLPRTMAGGGREIGLRLIVERRGIDFELTEDERLVFEAIGAKDEVPGGRAVLVPSATGTANEPRAGGAALSSERQARLYKRLEAILADPEKCAREIHAKVKRENPEMTQEQLEAGMGLLKIVFGIW